MVFQPLVFFIAVQAIFSVSTGSTNTISNGAFTSRLYKHIVKTQNAESDNLIFSPASIYTCLGLVFFGADGKTADEMVTGLHLTTSNKQVVAKQFENMLSIFRGPKPLLQLANKIYANQDLKLKPEFSAVARNSFESEAETLDFSDNVNAANTINRWVAEHTNNKINNLLNPGSINRDTDMVLVNAIHFKGNWKYKFELKDGVFYNYGQNLNVIKSMFVKGNFLYAQFHDLAATAIQLPYSESDLSMLIILPNEINGFQQLKEKLKNTNLIELVKNMYSDKVEVTIPKFKIESSLNMKSILSDMGMKTMFTNNAEFNLFTENMESKIGDVIHKAFIDVNEIGTEAAAATGAIRHSLRFKKVSRGPKRFVVDHPFYFCIMDKENIYFAGQKIFI